MCTPQYKIQFGINGQQTTDDGQRTTNHTRNVVRCFLRRDAPPARIKQESPLTILRHFNTTSFNMENGVFECWDIFGKK